MLIVWQVAMCDLVPNHSVDVTNYSCGAVLRAARRKYVCVFQLIVYHFWTIGCFEVDLVRVDVHEPLGCAEILPHRCSPTVSTSVL